MVFFILLFSFLLETMAGVLINPAYAQIPIQIEKGNDLNFGDVLLNSLLSGSVTIDPAGNKTVAGGVQNLGGTVTAASYQVVGNPNATFVIDLPTTLQVFANIGGVVQAIELSAFTSSPAGTGVLIQTNPGVPIGFAEVLVGATATLSTGQGGEVYSNNFLVNVEYIAP
jgi:uncharacterized protein DUF4402